MFFRRRKAFFEFFQILGVLPRLERQRAQGRPTGPFGRSSSAALDDVIDPANAVKQLHPIGEKSLSFASLLSKHRDSLIALYPVAHLSLLTRGPQNGVLLSTEGSTRDGEIVPRKAEGKPRFKFPMSI